jgi:multiple sugar transport system permease protein
VNAQRVFIRVGATVGLAVVASVSLLPYLWMVATAFKPRVDALSVRPKFLFTPTLQHFADAFIDKGFWIAGLNSLIVSISSVILVLLLGVPAAYVLSRYRAVGANHAFFFVLTTRMAPPIAIALPMFILFTSILNLFDTYLGLIVVTTLVSLAFCVWIMKAFFDGIPKDVDEAALLSGCSYWQAFWRVMIPTARLGIAATAIFCLLFAWGEFLFAMILTSRGGAQTLPVGIMGLITPAGTQWGQIAAVSTALTVPIIVLVFLVIRQLVRGLTFGLVR